MEPEPREGEEVAGRDGASEPDVGPQREEACERRGTAARGSQRRAC
jgi:hypothetical protein